MPNWRCTGCSKIFSDSAATHETTVAALTLGALGHNFENGACTRCGAADPDYVPPVIPGDVDGDGHVNARDVMAIMHHLVGDTPTVFDLAAADFNGDGKINNRDVLSMMIAIVNGIF